MSFGWDILIHRPPEGDTAPLPQLRPYAPAPRWDRSSRHQDHPERGAGRRSEEDYRPRTSTSIHYNDYTAFGSPLKDFKRAVTEAGSEDRARHLTHGDTHEFQVSAVAR